MSWRTSRLWVGLLALLAPLPLPFNEMALWPMTVAYLIIALAWLAALYRGHELLLKPWILNLLGALYMPVLLVDLASAEGGQVLRPLVHVAMFATAAKLFALRSERDKWHAVSGAFFLFVAGMGSSVHPALVLHMVVFSTVAVGGLVHFAEVQSLRPFPAARPIPGKRMLVGVVVTLSLLGCAVLFPLLPRVSQPYVAGGGSVDLGGSGGVAAFADDLTLDSIGRVRTDRGVAMRLVFDGPVPAEIRLKGSSYDLYRGQTWQRTQGTQFLRAMSGWVTLAERTLQRGQVAVFSRVTGAPMMPILTRAVTVESDTRWLGLSTGGDLRPVRWRGAPMRYRMAYGDQPMTLADAPPNPETLDRTGITPAIAGYASRYLSGPDTPLARVVRLERHLQDDFGYSLDLDLDPQSPIEDFLLRERSGHCEYFASALVMMLRAEGIPARVVSGFLGADGNPLEAFYVVRNSNAHAWVEAWVEGGWKILDPTPAIARPTADSSSSSGWWQRLTDTYDWLIYRWDRYVLTYSSEEQSNVFSAIWARLETLWANLWGAAEQQIESSANVEPARPVVEAASDVESDAGTSGWWWAVTAVLATAIAVALWWWLRRRHGVTATGLYLQLRSAAPKAGVTADDSSPPASVVDAWAQRQPTIEPHLRSILDAYLEESFGGREVGRGELAMLEEDWRAVNTAPARPVMG